MGNCKSKSKSHVIGPSYPDDSKGVFRYDKDSRKILFVGEDAEDTEITGLGSSQSYVSTSSKSAEPSGIHAEPVERSLLGEIADFLEDDGDDSTVNTMSTRGRNSPMLYIATSHGTNQNEIVQTASSSKTVLFDDSKLGIVKLTNDPYSIRKVLSDGTDNSDETADTSLLNGLNHLKSGDSQMQQDILSRQDPDPEDWDDDYISADTCKETPESPNHKEKSLDCDDVLQIILSDKEPCSIADDLEPNLQRTTAIINGESSLQRESSVIANDAKTCDEILHAIINDEESHSSADDLQCDLQRILSGKSEEMEEFYDDGYIPLTKTNSSDSSEHTGSLGKEEFDTASKDQTNDSHKIDQSEHKDILTGEVTESKSNPNQGTDAIKNARGLNADVLAGVPDNIQDHIDLDNIGTHSAEYLEKETPESHDTRNLENKSFDAKALPTNDLDLNEDITKVEVTSALLSETCTQSIGETQNQHENGLHGSKDRQYSLSETESDYEQNLTIENKEECSRHSQKCKVDELKLSMNDISFSDFSTNQDLASENENGISFDEDDDTDLSRDESLNKEDYESTCNIENNSFLSNIPDDERNKPTKITTEDIVDYPKRYGRFSTKSKTSEIECESDNHTIMDDLSCLLDENLGSSGDSDCRSPLMSPETVLNDNSSKQKDDVLSTEVKIGEKRCSLIPRVPQYSPIRCRSPYKGNRKSAIQPPSPARSFPRTPLDTVGHVSEHATSATLDKKTPSDQNTKFPEVIFSAGSTSSRGDFSVTPQSLPWDEKEGMRYAPSQQNNFPGSAASSVGTPKSSSKLKSHCASKWDPYLHMEKKGCERCLTLCSSEERDKFFELGRHQRVTKTSGGCTKNCSLYGGEKFYDSDAVVLCRICFHAVHRRSHIKTKDPTVRSLTTEYN